MPTAINTINTAEVASCLTNLGIWSYGVGGKQKTAYAEFYQICMATLAGGASANPARRARGGAATVPKVTRPRTRKAAATPAPGATQTPRRRGRPPGSTSTKGKTGRVRKNAIAVNAETAAILKCVAAGFGTATAMLPELKRTYGITIRPNHLGIRLSRLGRNNQLENNNGIWSLTTTGQELAKAA